LLCRTRLWWREPTRDCGGRRQPSGPNQWPRCSRKTPCRTLSCKSRYERDCCGTARTSGPNESLQCRRRWRCQIRRLEKGITFSDVLVAAAVSAAGDACCGVLVVDVAVAPLMASTPRDQRCPCRLALPSGHGQWRLASSRRGQLLLGRERRWGPAVSGFAASSAPDTGNAKGPRARRTNDSTTFRGEKNAIIANLLCLGTVCPGPAVRKKDAEPDRPPAPAKGRTKQCWPASLSGRGSVTAFVLQEPRWLRLAVWRGSSDARASFKLYWRPSSGHDHRG